MQKWDCSSDDIEGNIHDEEGENIRDEENGRLHTMSYIKCKPSITKQSGVEQTHKALKTNADKIQQSIRSRAGPERISQFRGMEKLNTLFESSFDDKYVSECL